ncbi:diguanylate phosphodiesterase [Vibrio owensii 47666-1]|uniref:EAL domain-containing protein n=1 Tax=Vibrio owensii TaxID=696485 RepID=UPI000584C8A9|nr:EAL domain-containing protein [Vibrio owensii]KIF45809.1 diguanylate phosphodiesterase [Vibrio owensii 47666-1]
MSELLSIAQGEVQPASGHSQVIDWSYDIQTREFECDQKGMMAAFGLKKPISGLDDLLEHMLLGQQDVAREKIAQIERDGGHGNLSCCLMPNETMLVHVDMSFERLNERIVQGNVIPQLSIIGCEELAKILETIFDLPNVGILVADQETRILGCNRAFEQQMGYENRDIVGLKTNIFSSDHHSKAFYDDIWDQIGQEGYWSGNLLSRASNGSNQAHHLCIYRLNFTSGRTLFLGFSTDISASLLWMKKAGEQAQQWSAFLPPRDEFESQLANLARENGNKDLNIVMTLRPNFSRKNLLEQQLGLADFMMRSRHASIAGQLSKDVFVVCLQTPRCKWLSPLRLIQIALRGFFVELRSELGSSMHDVIVEGQTGVSVLGYDTNNPRQALVHAAQAMVSAPTGDQSYFSFYNSDLHDELVKRHHLEAFLRTQIESQLVDVYFQPIIETRTGKIVKFEALARFYHQNKTYDTQEMISVVEDLELIAALDDVVCRTALKQLPHIQKVYGEEIGLTLNRSLNTKLDSLQVLQSSLDLIAESGVDPSRITIELTETAYFEQDQEHTVALEELRGQGIKIAIDDFGTGYSSFSYLEKGQFDLLKIDRKFVKNIEEGSTKYSIVKMITELAHKLNVKVVAEGVESEEELKVLASVGVDYMQGFLFSQAIPVVLLDKPQCHKKRFKGVAIKPKRDESLLSLSHRDVRRLDPGEPLSLAVEYMNLSPDAPLVVINEKCCVGLITKEQVNLHLTPAMGTDLESERENRIWKRPVNQVMNTELERVDANLPVSEVKALVKAGTKFPWILCDSQNEYRGLLTQEDVLSYLASL